MRNEEAQKAPPGAVPPIIHQPQASYTCLYPAKEGPAILKPAAPPEPKPEPTLEQKVPDEIERRLVNRVGAFALDFFVGEMVEQSWHKHDRD